MDKIRQSELEFVNEMGADSSAGSGERMAESDGAATDVELVGIDAEFLADSDNLGGERFVDL